MAQVPRESGQPENLSRAVIEVRLREQLQYVTTFGKYETATR